jgi:hypothetical protein
MNSQRLFRWVLPVALLGGACTSMLGIEDLHEGPDPAGEEGGEGSGGTSGGKGGSSGASGASGASGSAGKGGSSGASGASGASGSTSTGGAGGEGAAGGTEATGGTGTGGTGGSGGAGDTTVRGRVVTTWNQPIPNVTIMIGEAEADTNADGEFEIPDVADTYDAKFVINYDAYGSIRTYGWAYLGLTRRDPTLQVYNGLTVRSGDIAVTPQNLTSSTNRKLALALGSDDGENSYDVPLPGGYGQVGATWQGPDTTTVTAHGLLFERDSNSLPTVYNSYDEVLGVLSETTKATFLLDLPDETVSANTVSGTVTSPSSSDRTNYVFLRFQSNGIIKLVEHYGSTLNAGSFTYNVPSVAGSSIEVGAIEGDPSFGAAALVHKDRIAAGAADIALAIPTPPQQVAPAEGISNVTGSTIFTWTSQAHAFVWNAENIEPSSPYGGLYIVTGEKRVSIPEFANGFTLLPGDLYNWRVQVHGDPATVDDLADEDGFADSWAPWADAPNNPKRGDGSFTISAGRTFTTAP